MLTEDEQVEQFIASRRSVKECVDDLAGARKLKRVREVGGSETAEVVDRLMHDHFRDVPLIDDVSV